MTYDILYSLKGDAYIARHLKTVGTEEYARELCRTLRYFPAETIHYAITCEDGRTIYDSSKQGLIFETAERRKERLDDAASDWDF